MHTKYWVLICVSIVYKISVKFQTFSRTYISETFINIYTRLRSKQSILALCNVHPTDCQSVHLYVRLSPCLSVQLSVSSPVPLLE